MSLKPWQDTAQVRNDYAGAFRKTNLSRQVFEELNPIRKTVCRRSFARQADYTIGFNGVDTPSAELAGK